MCMWCLGFLGHRRSQEHSQPHGPTQLILEMLLSTQPFWDLARLFCSIPLKKGSHPPDSVCNSEAFLFCMLTKLMDYPSRMFFCQQLNYHCQQLIYHFVERYCITADSITHLLLSSPSLLFLLVRCPKIKLKKNGRKPCIFITIGITLNTCISIISI